MHLLESSSRKFECIPFVHEVSAAIAADFHNVISDVNDKAFVLVTAGPGLTNTVTAIAGAYLESRELLVVGGQVKSENLRKPGMRQHGIQEIDGISLVTSICKAVIRVDSPISQNQITRLVKMGRDHRKGPIFIEFCLDAQAIEVMPKNLASELSIADNGDHSQTIYEKDISRILVTLQSSTRPAILIGGDISYQTISTLKSKLQELKIPIFTTWNAADRIPSNWENFFGRPNTWGMRYSNILIQQCDLLLAIGTRLSLQQTGFNTQEFIPKGKIIHVYCDKEEFQREIPRIAERIEADSNIFLPDLVNKIVESKLDFSEWINFCNKVKKELPLNETSNSNHTGYFNPYDFYLELSKSLKDGDTLIPSSSGGAETVAMQTFEQAEGVRLITSASLASMGYGLAGAIGAAISSKQRTILVEGDGGFAQNIQELGTIERQQLNIKIFIFCNEGYASIRMTQKNYFNGHYVGCDRESGLGLPNWRILFSSYNIDCTDLNPSIPLSLQLGNEFYIQGPHAYLVPIHPDQTYYPKISSSIQENGAMVSSPLHEMFPPLEESKSRKVLMYLNDDRSQ